MINPIISLQQAWRIMNMLDANNKPLPFSVRATYCTANEKDEKFGKIIFFENVILARNGKYLAGNLPIETNPVDDEIIYARDWIFLFPDTMTQKALSHWHITHINDMEVNFPKNL